MERFPIALSSNVTSPRFSMLKAWVQNQSLGDIEIEERYRVWVANLRTDRYVTVGSPIFDIDTMCVSNKIILFVIEKSTMSFGLRWQFYSLRNSMERVRRARHSSLSWPKDPYHIWSFFITNHWSNLPFPKSMIFHFTHSMVSPLTPGQTGIPHPQAWIGGMFTSKSNFLFCLRRRMWRKHACIKSFERLSKTTPRGLKHAVQQLDIIYFCGHVWPFKSSIIVSLLIIFWIFELYIVYKVHLHGFTCQSWSSEASLSGRVKDAAAKGMLSKQLGGLTGDVAFLDQATGVIKSKKPKKRKDTRARGSGWNEETAEEVTYLKGFTFANYNWFIIVSYPT